LKHANLSWRTGPIPYQDATEETLVRAVLAGERGAWERLVEPYRGRVSGVAQRYVWDRDDAEHLTQEILLRAYQRLATFRGGSQFGTWLHTVAARLCMDHLKKRGLETLPLEYPDGNLLDLPAGYDTERAVLETLEIEELLERVNCLPACLRESMILTAVPGLPGAEIAERLGCPRSTIKTRLHRAREKMRAAGTEEGRGCGGDVLRR